MPNAIELIVENRVARVVLHRNAFTGEMMGQFADAMADAATRADILVLSSSTEDFSLGRDRTEPRGNAGPFAAFSLVTRANASVASFPGISVAVVRGRAFGFAVGMVMRCDIAIASDTARFALDEVKLGIPPMFIMAEILDHLPPKQAMDIVLTSREFDAIEAKEMGVLSRVVPDARLDGEAEALVKELRSRDAGVLTASKSYLGAVRHVPPAARGAYALVEQTRFATKAQH